MALDFTIDFKDKIDVDKLFFEHFKTNIFTNDFKKKYGFYFSYGFVQNGVSCFNDKDFDYTTFLYFRLDKFYNPESYRIQYKNIIDFLIFIVPIVKSDFIIKYIDIELLSMIDRRLEIYSLDDFWNHYNFQEELKEINKKANLINNKKMS